MDISIWGYGDFIRVFHNISGYYSRSIIPFKSSFSDRKETIREGNFGKSIPDKSSFLNFCKCFWESYGSDHPFRECPLSNFFYGNTIDNGWNHHFSATFRSSCVITCNNSSCRDCEARIRWRFRSHYKLNLCILVDFDSWRISIDCSFYKISSEVHTSWIICKGILVNFLERNWNIYHGQFTIFKSTLTDIC